MRASSHEVIWVLSLLEELPDVDLLAMRVDSDELSIGGERVPVIEIGIHAASWADAMVLAAALRLPEVEGRTTEGHYGTSLWRNWAGWASEASREQPVQVEVFAAELERELATLFDGSAGIEGPAAVGAWA